ncbi:MAG: hypothetical protein CL946_04625 [Ectothiorhodospiraceae bacterium]|nr:hypothetical protein [Ectothiorhodospiraceae bacterium]
MNKLGKSLALSCIAGLLLISCSEGGPEETFELMRQEACEGDVEGFFSYVDEGQMRKRLYESYFSDDEKSEDPTEAIAQYIVNFIILHFGQYINLDYMWELVRGLVVEDIQAGESSEFCTNKLIGPYAGSNNLIIESADGEKSIWEFKNQWGKWKLVGFSEYPEDTEDNDRITGETDKALDPRGPAPEQDGQPYDFRKTHWGMSKEEVKKNETAEFVGETDDALIYKEKIGGLDSKLVYMFKEGKLRNSAYKFENEYSEVEDYINDYEKLKDAYTKKYGEPHSDEVRWTNDTFKDDPSMLGQALIEGHASFVTQWSLPETSVILSLYKDEDEDEISLMAAYRGFKITNENTETLDIESGEIEEKL